MSIKQSNLSKYGYDFALATTHESINYNLKLYLHESKAAEVVLCYVNENGKATFIDYAELKQKANGSDPFTIQDGANPNTDQALKNLYHARFMLGIKAKIGLPPGVAPSELDIVSIGNRTKEPGTQKIKNVPFTLTCSEFQIVQYVPGQWGDDAKWINQSQPSGHPWLFQSNVDMDLSVTDESEYSKLPPEVQNQIKNLEQDAFSIRQLYFILDNAGLATSMPDIKGLDPTSDLYLILQKYFINDYFQKLREHGQPVLVSAIIPKIPPPSTIVLTDLNYEIDPLLDKDGHPITEPTRKEQNLATLNYLCATDGHPLPTPATFDWNWVEAGDEAKEFHGAVAFRYETFWNHFYKFILLPHIQRLCLKPPVSLHWEGNIIVPEWELLTAEKPDSEEFHRGSYSCAYKNEADATLSHALVEKAYFYIHTYYNLDLKLEPSAINIVQNYQVYLYLGGYRIEIHYEGTFIDKNITTRCELLVDENGQLNPKITNTVNRDNSQPPPNDDTDAGAVAKRIVGQVNNMVLPNLDLKTLDFQNWIFPGGKTFNYMDLAFSDNLDLVAHITYHKPTAYLDAIYKSQSAGGQK